MSEYQSLIGVMGLARSGKSEAVRYIHSAYGYEIVTASGLIRASLQRDSGRTTFARDELRQRGDELRQSYGADFVVTHAHNLESDRVVIDGLRIKRQFGHLAITAVFLLALRPILRRDLRAISSRTTVSPTTPALRI